MIKTKKEVVFDEKKTDGDAAGSIHVRHDDAGYRSDSIGRAVR